MKILNFLGRVVCLSTAILLGANQVAFAGYLSTSAPNSPLFVGEHLHTMTMMGTRLFVTGHEGAGRSDDGGKTWITMHSLDGADVMSWTATSASILAGGHEGLFSSTDRGVTFKRMRFYGTASDVHAIGASEKFVYLGSPQLGFLKSVDGGRTWKMRTSKIGQGFMGTLLVDPKDPNRVIAPDMSAGLLITKDGGLTWAAFGGPPGPMALAWNAQDNRQIAAIGMMTSGITSDGGKTWTEIEVPNGAGAIGYSADGKKLLVSTLVGKKVSIFFSTNFGKTWSTKNETPVKNAIGMDPNMPGMVHSKVSAANRPLALTLSTFGVASSAVLVSAIFLRKQDRKLKKSRKVASQVGHK